VRKILGLALILLSGAAADATAQMQAACTAGKTGKGASITAKDAWDLASARARAWKPDAVPFELTTTSLGPLDAEGRSKDWNIKFSSPGAKAVDLISITDGQISCYAMNGAGGRVIEWNDKIVLDSKKLYETAQKAGGDKLAGQKIMAGLNQNRPGGLTLWYLNYEGADGKQTLSVVIDAKTGEVTNVSRPGSRD
jgi:hypothetical protein